MPDLPLDERRTLATALLEDLLPAGGPEPLCALLTGAEDERPFRSTTPQGHPVPVVHDRDRHRGTAGSLRDFAQQLPTGSYLLAAAGAERAQFSLKTLLPAMLEIGADVVLPRLACGTPLGIWLIRTEVLQNVSPTGFIDFKEQALPRLAASADVRVLTLPAQHAQTQHTVIRRRAEYIRALRMYHGGRSALAEAWRSAFAVVEPGAEVHPEAILHDCVILRGARVERGAVVARSIVDDGVTIHTGERLVDTVATLRSRGESRRIRGRGVR